MGLVPQEFPSQRRELREDASSSSLIPPRLDAFPAAGDRVAPSGQATAANALKSLVGWGDWSHAKIASDLSPVTIPAHQQRSEGPTGNIRSLDTKTDVIPGEYVSGWKSKLRKGERRYRYEHR